MRVVLLLVMIAPLLKGCCDECGQEFPEPCVPFIIGTKKISKEFAAINLLSDSMQWMTFKNNGGYNVTYTRDIVLMDSIKGNDCDSTYFYEQRILNYTENKISPGLSFEIGYVHHRGDSLIEGLTVKIGNFRSFIQIIDSKSNGKFYDSVQVFGVTLRNVYQFETIYPASGSIKGYYYSIPFGLMAFYQDELHYWVRQ